MLSPFWSGYVIGLLTAILPAIAAVIWFILDCRELRRFGQSSGRMIREEPLERSEISYVQTTISRN